MSWLHYILILGLGIANSIAYGLNEGENQYSCLFDATYL